VNNIVVYIDHEDIVACGIWDDVVANPQTDMHKVINLVKVQPVERKEGEELPEFYRDLGKGIDFQSQAQGNVDIATLVIK
jgi:hypothetical protein